MCAPPPPSWEPTQLLTPTLVVSSSFLLALISSSGWTSEVPGCLECDLCGNNEHALNSSFLQVSTTLSSPLLGLHSVKSEVLVCVYSPKHQTKLLIPHTGHEYSLSTYSLQPSSKASFLPEKPISLFKDHSIMETYQVTFLYLNKMKTLTS